MQKSFPRTIKELKGFSTRRLIRALVIDERNRCTNIYATKYQEVTKLLDWTDKNVPDTRAHDSKSK